MQKNRRRFLHRLAQSALNRTQPSAAAASAANLPSGGGGTGANMLNASARAAYYVLVVITRGVFDDLKETVQALIFASRAPISVIFVDVGGADGSGQSLSLTI